MGVCVVGVETPFSIAEQIIIPLCYIPTFLMLTLCLMKSAHITEGLKAYSWVVYERPQVAKSGIAPAKRNQGLNETAVL